MPPQSSSNFASRKSVSIASSKFKSESILLGEAEEDQKWSDDSGDEQDDIVPKDGYSSKSTSLIPLGQIWTKVKGLMQSRDEIKEVLSGQRIDGLETRNVSV